jgi:hypothetical protein
MVIGPIDDYHVHFRVTQAARGGEPAKAGTDDDHYRFAIAAHRFH